MDIVVPVCLLYIYLANMLIRSEFDRYAGENIDPMHMKDSMDYMMS